MHAKANLACVSRIQELNRRMTHTSLELPLLCNTIGLYHPSLTLNNHLESLHEHICAGPIAEVVSLVLVHVLHSDVALSPGDVTPVASPALPGAADKNNDDEGDGDIMNYDIPRVHVGAALSHGVSAALLVVAVSTHRDLGV